MYDPAARPRVRDPMGHRNPDTIEDTRARKYTKIPTNPNPPKDQKNPADWRSLQKKKRQAGLSPPRYQGLLDYRYNNAQKVVVSNREL